MPAPRGDAPLRRSTVITLAIMLFAFGAMFAAAGSALRPLAQDAEVSRTLTRYLDSRGDIEKESRVRLSRLPASERRLASEGLGLVIELKPSKAVYERAGGLRILALRAAREALSRYPGPSVKWVEVNLEVPGPDGATRELRTLMTRPEGGELREPDPPLPATLTSPGGAPPKTPPPAAAPARPKPAGG